MIAMKRRRSLSEIAVVLEALGQTGAVIIGGQAINLWAEHYQTESPPWTELRPYTSFDLDVLGSQSDVLKCSEALKADPIFPGPTENTVNSGKIVTQIDGSEFEIDFLHSPNGLSPAEIQELARSITYGKLPLKVLHPLHCLESKTISLATLPQNAGERQDLKHLQLSVVILRAHLQALTLAGKSDPVLVRWARRVRMDSNHQLGLEAALKHGVRFQQAIPSELWRQRPGVLGDFMHEEWQAWEREIAEKTDDLIHVRQWIEDLNRRTNPGSGR